MICIHPVTEVSRSISLQRNFSRLALAASLCLLAACGNKQEAKTGQVVARVNGADVMAHQLSVELGNTGRAPDEANDKSSPIRKQVLEALIDRQILVGEAINNKLDRDPNVVQAVERYREQMLAQTYLQSKIAHLEKPTSAEIDAYFKSHPELFSQRRLFDVRQLVVATSDVTPELTATLESAKSLDEVASWLDQKKVDYVKVQQTRSTADLPGEVVSKLARLEKGQPFVVKDGAKSLFSSLTFVKDSPVSADVAAPQIERFLQNQKSQQSATAEISRLRALAKLEYSDPADQPNATAVAKVAPPANAPAAPANGAAPAQPAPNNGLERGIANIK